MQNLVKHAIRNRVVQACVMMRETIRAFRYCQAPNKVFCSEIFESEFGVTLDNRSEWLESQSLNYFAVHGDVCEYAPKDMHELHQQARISIVLDESSTRNIGSIWANRHSADQVRNSIQKIRV
jgi:hypothetical protein